MALLTPTEKETNTISNISETSKETISKDIETLMGQSKKILTSDQNDLLRTTLGVYFLNNDMKDAFAIQVAGGDATSRTRTKIAGLCRVFDISCND
jgi:hypothetical protein